MAIDTNLLKDLRERTGAGILDCKKALTECNNDLEQATTWLREKGIAKAVKKASRISAEGVFNVIVNGNKALIYELNCETDFVASNAKFKDLVDKVGAVLVNADAKCTDCALEAKDENGTTVKDIILGTIAVIGENITLRNVKVIEKKDDEVFGVYKHNGGKIAVVAVVKGSDAVAKDIAMHVCAENPTYLDKNGVDQAYLENEKKVLTEQAQAENPNKPLEILSKMVEGRIQKELKAICLMDQGFVKDPNTTVAQYLSNAGATIVTFSRNVVGEGVQKKENNFVEEVMSQIK